MDAVKFIEERNRMCKSFDNYCYDCPAWYGSCKLETGTYLKCEADKQVEIVKEWSAAHPRKTRQSALLELFPNAHLDGNGIVDIDSCKINEIGASLCSEHKTCSECRREFWSQEVE